ncbi:putative Flp/Fap pilin component [Vibrio nigripulchritudo MADA3029]|nr:Flp family type IVb pilin [Vibrio nigripulchritudo]CCN46115.1 putative Flp/Fap pilin component [Vibrio nigripulchritudo MADA3020]CCN51170.1 putative Flp/Fap pilin component [Vibrio nigripulchritudo MADA3021]CCN56856.1 putative Flp/Fap pilin component [Vibrio nigripulchritudo MADA3029]CCN83438.1 putative Flp/Fap pilin component [Vibrio nigripulchritudo BLFn1]CCN88797.1 putative Flp/Fap pilin component [Vibrio nigripulchritudo SFn27]
MFSNFKKQLRKFIKDERGVTAVEYAIIAVVISGLILIAFNSELGEALKDAIEQVKTNLGTAKTNGTPPQ